MGEPVTLILQPAEWHLDALCAQVDAETFFPEKGGSHRDAKRICSGCPVRAECLQFSLDNDERFGIWGGLSGRERSRLRNGDLTVLSDQTLWRCGACGVKLMMFKGRVCSAVCRHQLAVRERPTVECVECGGPVPNKSRHYKFCTVQCRQRAYNRRRPKRGTATRKTVCAQCTTTFQGTRGARYCSPECRALGPAYAHKPHIAICDECSTAFMARLRGRWCSKSCKNRHHYKKSKTA